MNRIFLIILLFFCKAGFAQPGFKIGVYERLIRLYVPEHSDKIRYGAGNLFIKLDSTWTTNDEYQKKDTFYLIEKGSIGARTYGYMATNTQYFFSRRKYFYILKPKREIVPYLRKSMRSITTEKSTEACFVTNNNRFKRNTTLLKYTPGEQDKELIKTNFFRFIKNQFLLNCGQVLEEHYDVQQRLTDSINMLFDTGKIKIDRPNTFIDQKGNKLITFTIPYYFLYHSIYPFARCFREDSGYEGLRLTCYINNKNEILFLQDELNYLEHGDFDNDGKDEFLFWYSIFNHDGYIIFYNDFRSSTEFNWSFH
jgi:hypothetical protein